MAQAIESVFADMLDDHAGELAHHYSLSGNTVKAVEYLNRSGHRALNQSAFTQAITHLTRGLDVLSTQPPGPDRIVLEAQMELDLASALMAAHGYSDPRVGEHCGRARDAAEAIGNRPMLARALLGGAIHDMLSGDVQRARDTGTRLLELSAIDGNQEMSISGHILMGIGDLSYMQLQSARQHLESGLEILSSTRGDIDFMPGQDPSVVCLSFLALVHWTLGFPERAIRQSEQARATARKLDQPFVLALALAYGAQIHIRCGEEEKARVLLNELLEISSRYGFQFWAAQARLLSGMIMSGEGHDEEGLEAMRREMEQFQSMGAELPRMGGLLMQAVMHSKLGQADRALELLAAAEKQAHESGLEERSPDIHHLRGQAFERLYGKASTEAEKCYRRSIVLAREAGAHSYELRAAYSLARLLQQRGETDEARELLEKALALFTEGHMTLDHRKARGLLQELQAPAEPDASAALSARQP
jgi:tetratricopeptide (TPR) repeat protein